MRIDSLTDSEQAELERHGLSRADAERQLAAYADPPPFTRLIRPCTRGDGIVTLDDGELARFGEAFDKASSDLTIVKFIPASGAASRMFKTPLAYLHGGESLTREALAQRAQAGEADAAALLRAVDGLERFAFHEDLRAVMARADADVGAILRGGDLRILLSFLLTDSGLDYASLPKALLAFHRYPDGPRTAFEEHLVEAANYARGRGDTSRLHFTVSPEHVRGFETLLARVRERYERRFGLRYDVDFSLQKPSTDALAVDAEGRPFRERDGSLLFRPGGHGALIENLNDIDADLVFLKNIDNVVPDHAKAPTHAWKRGLGGFALALRARVLEHWRALESGADEATVTSALHFLERELFTAAPERIASGDTATREQFARRMLDRPLRVCGMVVNTGEPGGGPFWVDSRGRTSLQIVETSQVDPRSSEQRAMLGRSTHFNPVDLVCAYRRPDGSCYELSQHVDPDTVFISEKSKDGRPLRSLERPGLWNGAMADWNTVFVEVPIETFAPVKTMEVLLDPAHQPAE